MSSREENWSELLEQLAILFRAFVISEIYKDHAGLGFSTKKNLEIQKLCLATDSKFQDKIVGLIKIRVRLKCV